MTGKEIQKSTEAAPTPSAQTETAPTTSAPSLSGVQDSLKASIKSGVQSANKVLASLEQKADKYGQPIVSSLHKIEHEGEVLAHKATSFYDQRKQYGPEIIVGSALLVGTVVGLRRGRIPAVATATATGFLAYLGVYEIDLHRMPDVIFGKEDK